MATFSNNRSKAIGDAEFIIIDDDDDDELEIFEHSSLPQKVLSPLHSHKSRSEIKTTTISTPSIFSQREDSKTLSPEPSNIQAHPNFRSLDWGTTTNEHRTLERSSSVTPQKMSNPRAFGSRSSTCSRFEVPPSTSQSSKAQDQLGSLLEPITLDDENPDIFRRLTTTSYPPQSDGSRSSSLVPRRGYSGDRLIIQLDEHSDPNSAFSRSLNHKPTKEDELIEIEDIESELELERYAFQDNSKKQGRRKSSKIGPYPRRNATIVAPLVSRDSFPFESSELRPTKTVEVKDGSFLRITDIIFNSSTKEVRLRGHRLERVRDLNGLLEKKANELAICFEVDLDDARDPEKQGSVEISLDEVVKIRLVRLTNERFPLNRMANPKDYFALEDMLNEGGLTLRWKHICKYATAADRHNNSPKERSLERLREEEAPHFSVPESDRRFLWRGETIAGGAYRPTLEAAESHIRPPIEQQTNSSRNNWVPEFNDLVRVPVRAPSIIDLDGPSNSSHRHANVGIDQGRLKRKYDSGGDPWRRQNSQSFKRLRKEEFFIEQTRPHLSRVDVSATERQNPRTASRVANIFKSNAPPLSKPINITTSPLSAPPTTGSIHTKFITKVLITRLPGQKLAYGDAFCGAGGSASGAKMAGLHIKWGFDMNKDACASWRTNFPTATCFERPAHDFVSLGQQYASYGESDKLKVDILHLSPPCQFFSPAHTWHGKNDEVNIASLFAVQDVIRVCKPRVVTLEQTFGILHHRFRFYFHALIQMFTMQDFSVRWEVVRLQDWGLQQRRRRLIIIASCPGEILPQLPPQTHCDRSLLNPSNPTTKHLKPYTTISQALHPLHLAISHNTTPVDHDPSSVPQRDLEPYDTNQILPRAISCKGGQNNYHPSGKRDFTIREYACLQGFPMEHVFKGNKTEVKRQIGNAVPPVVARVLFESIKRDLDKADGVVEEVVVLD